MYEENVNRELGWDDEIEKDGGDFYLLPEGDYDFTVKELERGRYQGGDKLPPCNRAIVTLQIEGPDGDFVDIKHQLFLHTKTEGLLSAFFCAIGLKKHGEKLRMDWSKVVGSTGRAKIYIDTYKNDKGEDRQANKVKKFYDKEYAAPTSTAPYGSPASGYQQPTYQAPSYQTGKF